MAWLMIQTGSMIYELFEWLLTIVMTPDAADNYNGQQGDMWDAQKDMAMALVGSTGMFIVYMLRCFITHKDKAEPSQSLFIYLQKKVRTPRYYMR